MSLLEFLYVYIRRYIDSCLNDSSRLKSGSKILPENQFQVK